MRFYFVLFSMFWCLNAEAVAQVPALPTPTPTPGSRAASVTGVLGDNASYDRLRSIELHNSKNKPERHPLLDPKKGIYRRPGRGETEILAVSEPLLSKYSAFLNEPDTGIVKLNGESSCISDSDTVVVSEKCIPFKMPGAGTSFSFRTEGYRLPRLADVILLDGVFRTGGVFQQVIMTNVGDLPIEEVTLNTTGMKYLVDLKPVSGTDEFTRFEGEVVKGIESDGFIYRKGHPVKENSTFALRSIAYRGKYMRSVDGIAYDELDYDKRRDVVVAFRVVEIATNGNVTIIWKRLKDIDSPKLKMSK